jgi:ankyrin repeat protein
MWATHRQQHRIIELLLTAGANRTHQNQGGLTALDLAHINKDRHAIDLLTPTQLDPC